MSSIRQIFDSILLKHFKKSITILPPQTAVKKSQPQQKTPLPISSGLPERFPIYRSFFHLFFPRNYDRVYARKREYLQKTKEAPLPEIDVSPELKSLIIRSSVTELLKLLNEDEITSQQLVFTYMERAQQIGIDMNYITDLNIEEAFEDARRCDEIRANTPYNQRDKLGLLFGIPISVKENILQRGFDSTCGLATRCFMPSKKDSIAVELLRKEGAIPFARSTVPQLLSVIETISHIWGRANNPWDETRSTGGSSGGEAGLIAMALSPIGLGTDGMGSLRIPASWCGIYSFKPTSGRPSWKGSMALLNYLSESRWNVLYPGIGPMGRTVDDLILVTKALCQKENKESDPALPFIEWRHKEVNITKKLKLGYVLSEEMYGSSKAARRAVLEAVEEFRRQGHDVEEIRIPNFNDIVRMALSLTTSEGAGRGNMLALNGESLIYEMRSRMGMLCIPRWLRRPFLPLLRLLGEERAAFLGNWTAGLNGDQWVWILHEKDHIQQRLFNFWKEKELDAIITPTTALPALHHGNSGELSMNICYVWVANMFNLPTGVVPITRVKEGEDYYGEEDSVHRDLLYRLGVKSMKGSVGLPMSIQVMTMPYEDEKCLGIMKLLEDRFPAMIKM